MAPDGKNLARVGDDDDSVGGVGGAANTNEVQKPNIEAVPPAQESTALVRLKDVPHADILRGLVRDVMDNSPEALLAAMPEWRAACAAIDKITPDVDVDNVDLDGLWSAYEAGINAAHAQDLSDASSPLEPVSEDESLMRAFIEGFRDRLRVRNTAVWDRFFELQKRLTDDADAIDVAIASGDVSAGDLADQYDVPDDMRDLLS